MDRKQLFDAACVGNVEVLHKLLDENPLILTDVALTSPRESLLHVATKAGQLDFVHELINNDHEQVKELSQHGFRPLDIASMMGNVELVKELVRNDHEICLLKGKDQRTALHYAAMKGRIEVIDELLSTCPELIKDVTIHGKTALHLAVETSQFDAFQVLVKWLERLRMETIINWVDFNGNTVLILAAFRKQVDTIKLLLNSNNTISGILEVNVINSRGLTALDLLDMVMESPKDLYLKEILQRAGAHGAQHANPVYITTLQQAAKPEQANNDIQSKPSKDWFKFLKFEKERDSPSDARNALLVVAALIATVTFQAGVTPPNGILQPNDRPNNRPNSVGLADGWVTFLFIFANTLGLTAALSIITYLTVGFPFQRELLISMVSMMFAYGFAIISITEGGGPYALLVAAFLITLLHRWLLRWGRKLCKHGDKLPATSSP